MPSIYGKFRASSVMDFERNINKLASDVEKQAMREAVRKASTPMLQDTRAKAPVRTGALKESLAVKVKTYKRGNNATVMAIIGPDSKFVGANGDTPAKYAHLVEFGTEHSAAHPFLRPAFDATKDESQRVYAASLKPAIQRIAARVNKRRPI